MRFCFTRALAEVCSAQATSLITMSVETFYRIFQRGEFGCVLIILSFLCSHKVIHLQIVSFRCPLLKQSIKVFASWHENKQIAKGLRVQESKNLLVIRNLC